MPEPRNSANVDYAQPFQTSPDRAAAMLPWITDCNVIRPHSALGGKPSLIWLATPRAQIERMTTATATSDPEPRFVGVAGVKPRAATAGGGLGLTPVSPTQAESATGWDNLLGNDS
jgi:hypothetical protein